MNAVQKAPSTPPINQNAELRAALEKVRQLSQVYSAVPGSPGEINDSYLKGFLEGNLAAKPAKSSHSAINGKKIAEMAVCIPPAALGAAAGMIGGAVKAVLLTGALASLIGAGAIAVFAEDNGKSFGEVVTHGYISSFVMPVQWGKMAYHAAAKALAAS